VVSRRRARREVNDGVCEEHDFGDTGFGTYRRWSVRSAARLGKVSSGPVLPRLGFVIHMRAIGSMMADDDFDPSDLDSQMNQMSGDCIASKHAQEAAKQKPLSKGVISPRRFLKSQKGLQQIWASLKKVSNEVQSMLFLPYCSIDG